MMSILERLKADLIASSDEQTRISGERFFREEVKLHGVKSAMSEKFAKEYFREIKDRSKSEIFDLCEELWKTGYLEEAAVACNWSYYIHKSYEPADFETFERWIGSYVTNWAACDTLCNHSVGALVEMYPEKINDLKRFAHSENRWTKRASAVSLIIPARKGLFLNDIFEIAEILLTDTDDMVRKGYGWMLKAASQAHQEKVFGFIMKHKSIMPRTSLRYAIEKMPADLKLRAMAK